jgi:hypothetical protein
MSSTKSFGRKKKKSEDMSLQITSMADIFMILLVFLLKSFAGGSSPVTPSGDIMLPEAMGGSAVRETIKLEILPNVVVVDDKNTIALERFGLPAQFKPEIESSSPLLTALNQERKRRPTPNMESNILLLADQRTPYSTLKYVLATASAAGFVDLQMVIVAKE